jgi:hypothetical protein
MRNFCIFPLILRNNGILSLAYRASYSSSGSPRCRWIQFANNSQSLLTITWLGGNVLHGERLDGDVLNGNILAVDRLDGDGPNGDVLDGDVLEGNRLNGDGPNGNRLDDKGIDGDGLDGDGLDGDRLGSNGGGQ